MTDVDYEVKASTREARPGGRVEHLATDQDGDGMATELHRAIGNVDRIVLARIDRRAAALWPRPMHVTLAIDDENELLPSLALDGRTHVDAGNQSDPRRHRVLARRGDDGIDVLGSARVKEARGQREQRTALFVSVPKQSDRNGEPSTIAGRATKSIDRNGRSQDLHGTPPGSAHHASRW